MINICMYPNNVINVFNFSSNEHNHYETFMIVNMTTSCYVIIIVDIKIIKIIKFVKRTFSQLGKPILNKYVIIYYIENKINIRSLGGANCIFWIA